MKQYQIIFTDMLNQRILGGQYEAFEVAIYVARYSVGVGKRSTWQIVRMSDGIVLAQSKVAES